MIFVEYWQVWKILVNSSFGFEVPCLKDFTYFMGSIYQFSLMYDDIHDLVKVDGAIFSKFGSFLKGAIR